MSNSYEPSSFGQSPMKKPGMSKGTKVLLILGILLGGMCLLCCGGFLMLGWWAQGLASEDPVVIARVTNEIAQIDIPDELEPTMSIDVKLPIVGTQVMVIVVHADKQTSSMLMLMALGEMMAGQDPEQTRQAIEQQLQGQKVEGQENIRIEKSDTKEIEINGQPATFTISQGVGTKSNTPRIQVTGVFQGKTGQVMLMFDGQAETFTEQRVVEMLESIERKGPPVDEEPPADDEEGPPADDEGPPADDEEQP